jgi:hypothetical protein
VRPVTRWKALAVELAVGRAERGQARVLRKDARQALFGHRHVRLGGRCGQHAVAHHALQRGIAQRVGFEHRRVDVGRLLADAVRLDAVLLVPLGLRDVVAIDAGHLLVVAGALVALDTEEHERGNDQQEQENHDDLVVLAEEIKHA